MRRSAALLLLLFPLVFASAPTMSAAARSHRVLVLYSYQRDFATHASFSAVFRTELARMAIHPISFIEIGLQPAGSTESQRDSSVIEDVRATFAGRPLDLVVTIGGPAAVFAQEHRHDLFPTTPLVLAGVDRRFVETRNLAALDTAVTMELDPAQMVDNVLQVLPETRTVFVVIGTSHLEHFWVDELKRGMARFAGRLTFTWLNELPFEEILRRSSTLPPHSAILYGVFTRDTAGRPHVEQETLAELHRAANAPIFGLFSTQLGSGIVGGRLLRLDELGRNSANVALRVLHGEPPSTITTPLQVAGAPLFDARELTRWKIAENHLPAGSIVQFRVPTTWQRYRPVIITGVTIAAMQGVLVIALLVNLARRRRIERSLRASAERSRLRSDALSGLSRKLMQAQERERAWIARELHDELSQRLMVLTMQLHHLSESPQAANEELRARCKALRDQLAELGSEAAALSHELHSEKLAVLGLPSAARALCEEAATEHDANVEFHYDDVPGDLPGELSLALFRVLEEALSNALHHSRVRYVSVSLRRTGDAIQLDVTDNGIGFDPEEAMRQSGLGLLGMMERISLVHGECAIDSRPGGGTRVRARVPVPA